MIKKITRLFLAISISFMFFISPVLARGDFVSASKSDEEIKVYFFSRNGCPHCTNEYPFLERLEQKYPEVKVYKFDIAEDEEGLNLLKEFEKEFNIKVAGVPFTVVEKEYFTGWYNEETTGTKIENAVLRVRQGKQEKVEVVSSQDNPFLLDKTKVVKPSLPVVGILHRINSYIVLIFSLWKI